MKLVHDRLYYTTPWEFPDIFLFTGNPIINKSGGIVMGRGAAKEVRDAYPGVDRVFGRMIQKDPTKHLLWAEVRSKSVVGWFKVKNHWMEEAKPELIQASTEVLADLATRHKKYQFHINFPGIGNGQLSVGVVLPILEQLPDNVRVYKIAPQLEEHEIPW